MTKFPIFCLALVLLTGCATELPYLGTPAPFIEVRLVHNIQAWSDWMIKDDRKDWMGSNPRGWLAIGLEWEHKFDCPTLTTGTSIAVGAPFKPNGPELYWATLSCGKRWGGK